MKIQGIECGFPVKKEGVSLLVRVLSFETDAPTCTLYFEMKCAGETTLANGNITLTEEQFAQWGKGNASIEDIALGYIGAVRDTSI